jgi:peroxiredoxin
MKQKYSGKFMRYAGMLAFCIQFAVIVSAQNPDNQPAMADPSELQRLFSGIETYPDSLGFHQQYIKLYGIKNAGLEQQYAAWMKKFPKSATVPFAYGVALAGIESPKAKPYLLKALAIDHKLDKAYFHLWIDGERWGDFNASREYLAKARQIAPDNADYAFYYANTFSETDPEKYRKLSMDVVNNFPNTERGAQALYWLANRSDDPKEKTGYYELQRSRFPADKFSWTSSGMSEYFDLLLKTEPEKSLQLAQSMVELKGRDVKTWEANVSNAQNIIKAQALLKEGRAQEAAALLDNIVIKRWSSAREEISLLKAKAQDAAGQTAVAYKNLLVYFAKEPNKRLEQALQQYGKKLGRSQEQISGDVWLIRDTSAKQAPNFTLQQYLKKGPASLSDYKGKVVLITYWFPGCGPCRGEFPHFENVVRKFKGQDFVYLGINIAPDQDEYVVPFMRSSGYSFLPLRDDSSWVKGPLDNRNAAPVNFLIDGNGRIIFANFRTDGHNEDALEFMIGTMLNRKGV